MGWRNLMKYIENIVINSPLVPPEEIFASSYEDWINNEQDKTFYANEIFLPKIMVELGIVKSISEIRRNKPELVRELNDYDYLEVKWGKKRLFILVGKTE